MCFGVFIHVCIQYVCADYELSSMQGAPGDGDLMLICIAPDKEGKFGFNVKVGLCLLFTTHTQFYVLLLLHSSSV